MPYLVTNKLVKQPETKSGGRLADQPLVKCGFGSSTGLHNSLVRASAEAFRTYVFDALEGARDGCLLGGPIRRRVRGMSGF